MIRARDTIFIVGHAQEGFRAKVVKLCYVFVNLEKAFDRIPGMVRWKVR